MRIIEQEISAKARWSLRLALFMAQLIIVTVLLHRFGSFPTPATINLVVVSLLGAATAMLLAVLALVRIWNTGIRGTGQALWALLVGLMIFATPLYYLPNLLRLPAINDVSTDLLSPPQFTAITQLRPSDANGTTYPGASFIAAQAKAYPDIHTLTLERSTDDAFDLVRGIVEGMGWDVAREQAPDKRNVIGVIEATDQSRVLGFKDDVVIRVEGENNAARIDMRSASRYGRHDLGANAQRIRKVFALIKTRIARAEAKRLDDIERARIAKRTLAERKRRENERKQKEQPFANAPALLPKARFDQGEFSTSTDTGEIRREASPPRRSTAAAAAVKPPSAAPATQTIQRSKRKRRTPDWVPFNLDAQ